MQEIHLDILKMMLLLKSATLILVNFRLMMHSIKHLKYTEDLQ